MKPQRLLILTLLTLPLAFFAGCKSSDYSHDETGLYAKHNQGYNVLGIVNSEPESFRDISETTDNISSYELYKRKNVSGDSVSVLWGAFTFSDY